ncbi:MAG: MMPL family transporter [Thermoanaerobaculales bacterium]
MRRFDRIFLGVSHISYHSWRAILVLFAVLAVLSPFLLRGLRIETASASFIATDDPVSRVFRESLSRFGENDPLVIQVRYGSIDRNTVDRFTDQLAEAIAAMPDVALVESQPAAFLEGALTIAMVRAALLNSDPAAMEAFSAALEQDAMRLRIRRTRKRIVLAENPLDRKLLAADPLDIRSFLIPFYEARTKHMRFTFNRGYFDAPDERSRLLFVQPTGSGEDTVYCVDLIERMAACVDTVRRAIPEARDISCRFTGKYALTGESASVLKRDMLRISTIAFVLVFLLLFLVFKGWRAAAVCILPILMAFLPVLIVARLFFNPLNFMATGFAAIIIGLGVDVMLHCTARLFQFTSQKGIGLEEAISRTLTDCGPPVVVGVLTTAGAFLSLVITDYRALVQFGLLTSSGLVVSLVVSLGVFPAVARWLLPEKSRVTGGLRFVAWPVAIFSRCWKYPWISLATTAVLILASLLPARNFAFDTDFEKLLPRQLEAFDVAREISEQYGASFLLNTQLVLESDTYEKGIAIQQRVDETLERMVRDGQVAGFYSPTLYFTTQSPGVVQAGLLDRAATSLAANKEFFLAQIEEVGLADKGGFRDYYEHLQRVVASPEDFSSRELPLIRADSRGRRFVSGEVGDLFFQTYIWPLGAAADATAARNVQAVFEAFDVPPGASLHVTGTHRLFEHLHEVVGSNFLRVSLISGLLVTSLIFFFFRRPGIVALSLLPLLAATPATFAMIVVTGIPFSPLGIGVTAIVIGVGIDDAVHILERVRLNPDRNVREAMVEIGPILTLTSLSSIIGFGALSFADHYVLSSMGMVVAFGVFACWFFSMLSLPAAFLIKERMTQQRTRKE